MARWLSLLRATALFVVLGSSAFVVSNTQASAADSVKIAVGVDPVFTPWWIAEQQGFFKKHGIQAEITQFSGGSDIGDAVMAGAADFGSSGTATWMPRIASGQTVVVAAMAKGIDNYRLAARSEVQSLSDLHGKTVATVGGTSTDYLWELVAERIKATPQDLKIINVGPPELVSSLDRGDVAAFFAWEPWPSKAVEISGKDKVHIIASNADLGYFSNVIVVGNRVFVSEHPNQTKQLIEALRDAIEFMAANPAVAVKVGAETNHISPTLSAQITSLYKYQMSLDEELVASAMKEEAWMRSKGRIKGPQIVWQNAVNREYFEQAMADK